MIGLGLTLSGVFLLEAYGLYATMSKPYFRQAGTSSFSIALVIGLYIACHLGEILAGTHESLGGPGEPLYHALDRSWAEPILSPCTE